MKTSGDRLKALLKECNLTASDLAAQRNVAPQHVNNWFNRGIPLARVDELAELLCVNRRWLLTGQGRKYAKPILRPLPISTQTDSAAISAELAGSDARLIRLPYHQARDGRLLAVPERGLTLPAQALAGCGVEPAAALSVSMPSDNMEPQLPQGATLAIDRGMTRIVDGEAYALLHKGYLRVHQLSQGPSGAWYLHSQDTDRYPSERYTAEQRAAQAMEIIGWVFWWSHLRPARPR
ncbi:helix-turn-helix transcriptional regulator [Pseudomonas fulva]|nr:XRE family transcriptional regulator [Pseudomonas fulva]MBF8780082.1 helix-turn-helix transcriptional regulator [Pseudomonas fulva]